jgi:hypothetical protein
LSTKDVPLDPREIAEIEDMISVLTDAALQQEWRTKLLRKAQSEANAAAEDRRIFRTALERARSEGHPDPEGFAAGRVEIARLHAQHEKRVAAIFKRAKRASRRRHDKTETKLEKASKTANPTRRRFPQRDRMYLEIVGEAEKDGHLADRPLVVEKLEKALGPYRLPHWEKTTISLKVMAMSVVSAKEGAQTINLRPNQATCSKALKSPRGPAGYMQDMIRKALERAFGKGRAPDFWFVIETDDDTRFHLHGAVETPNHPDAVTMVDAALRAAGGTWDDPKGQHHQQLTKGVDEPLWWAFYAVKTMNIGRRRLGEAKLFASTAELRSRARAGWDDLRAALPQSDRRGS